MKKLSEMEFFAWIVVVTGLYAFVRVYIYKLQVIFNL